MRLTNCQKLVWNLRISPFSFVCLTIRIKFNYHFHGWQWHHGNDRTKSFVRYRQTRIQWVPIKWNAFVVFAKIIIIMCLSTISSYTNPKNVMRVRTINERQTAVQYFARRLLNGQISPRTQSQSQSQTHNKYAIRLPFISFSIFSLDANYVFYCTSVCCAVHFLCGCCLQS